MRRTLWLWRGSICALAALWCVLASAADLTFEERVAAQRAIERVYYEARIWPEVNGPKLSFEQTVPVSVLRDKVAEAVANSNAVSTLRGRPLSATELRAEVERMKRTTRAPEMLDKLFAALGNDPWLIAEMLARPLLAERFLEAWNAKAQPFDVVDLDTDEESGSTPAGGPCADGTWDPISTFLGPGKRAWHTAVWTGTEMIVWGGRYYAAIPNDGILNSGARYNPATNSWTRTSAIGAPEKRSKHTAVWTGTEMIVWGGQQQPSGLFKALSTGGRYNPVTNTWVATSLTNTPPQAYDHTAVWTGQEMIVWGGQNQGGSWATVGRYNPSTNSWILTPPGLNAPTKRYKHVAVWTGSEMLVWGGWGSFVGALNDGGRYNPNTNSWTPISTVGAPAPRQSAAVVWTGSKMLVWGGALSNNSPTVYDSGGLYDPAADSWTPTSLAGAPPAATLAQGAWTGTQMVVWGGRGTGGDNNGVALDTGGIYTPATDSWTATSLVGAPLARANHSAVWTGSQFIVFGGQAEPPGPMFQFDGRALCVAP